MSEMIQPNLIRNGDFKEWTTPSNPPDHFAAAGGLTHVRLSHEMPRNHPERQWFREALGSRRGGLTLGRYAWRIKTGTGFAGTLSVSVDPTNVGAKIKPGMAVSFGVIARGRLINAGSGNAGYGNYITFDMTPVTTILNSGATGQGVELRRFSASGSTLRLPNQGQLAWQNDALAASPANGVEDTYHGLTNIWRACSINFKFPFFRRTPNALSSRWDFSMDAENCAGEMIIDIARIWLRPLAGGELSAWESSNWAAAAAASAPRLETF